MYIGSSCIVTWCGHLLAGDATVVKVNAICYVDLYPLVEVVCVINQTD